MMSRKIFLFKNIKLKINSHPTQICYKDTLSTLHTPYLIPGNDGKPV